MTNCFFTSDLHGHRDRYQKLFQTISSERPEVIFLGGDFLPSGFLPANEFGHDFIRSYLLPELEQLREQLADGFPRIFLIMGNDDERAEEPAVREMEHLRLLEYIHSRKVTHAAFGIYGYAYVPPTPFLLKDWERYDLSHYVDPGSISPEEGRYSYPVNEWEQKHSTIKADLERLAGDDDLDQAVFLFHAPPHGTYLDRAALDGVNIDRAPLDVHLGSIAIRQFIEKRQPLLTLHGHIHESTKLSHAWRDQIGRTHLFSAAHDGRELALVCFNLENPGEATRRLI